MAEDVIDHAERVGQLVPRPSPTAELAIHGAGGPNDAAAHLSVYGSDAAGVLALGKAHAPLDQPLVHGLPIRQYEVLWHARQEMARTVEDVLARRTRALLLDARASIAAAPTVARLLAQELGRDATWIEAQVAGYTALARGYLIRAGARPELVATPKVSAHSTTP
ncbi:MAG: glycerol-3-phosphate dehydrogenase C-terminal domain-containing protein, partial [Opitutaceae bacterium]